MFLLNCVCVCVRGFAPARLRIFDEVLSSFRISSGHLTHVWDFAHGLEGQGLPTPHKLRNTHCMEIFRQDGIYIKWKQYCTDEVWSTPVLLVPSDRTCGRICTITCTHVSLRVAVVQL